MTIPNPAAPSIATVVPDARQELTLRAIITAVIVAILIGASYPYIVLKLGYGPNMSHNRSLLWIHPHLYRRTHYWSPRQSMGIQPRSNRRNLGGTSGIHVRRACCFGHAERQT